MSQPQDQDKQLRKVFALLRKLKWEVECLYSDPAYFYPGDRHNLVIELEALMTRVCRFVMDQNKGMNITGK